MPKDFLEGGQRSENFGETLKCDNKNFGETAILALENFGETGKVVSLHPEIIIFASMKRVFRRKIYGRMKAWKSESSGRTALLIEGARRVR